MKKSLIAGASALALGMAVIPAAGVFAADITTMTDEITVTISGSCTFNAGGTEYTKAMEANKLETVGTTAMKVTCNNAKGYAVTGTFTDLTGPEKKTTGNEKITYSTTAATAGSGTWSATVTPTVGGVAQDATQPAASNGAIISSTTMTPAAGDSASIVYKVGTTNNQAAGSYEGTATYTLTAAS